MGQYRASPSESGEDKEEGQRMPVSSYKRGGQLCSENPTRLGSPSLFSRAPEAAAAAVLMATMETAVAKTVKDVSPHEFVKAYSAHLKRSGKMELPEWTDIVKTGRFKELAPYDPDWYYIRAASMARKIYLRQGIGVGGFQKIYGGRKRNGSRPPHFCKSSGAIARHILQQLETMNIIEIDPKGGRKITSQGQRDLDQVAGRV
ncbi:40S ribosomal protein [Musa troglodytarum]|uniref:40S ribosomal protein n=1 Tax=Musa troglodytarum TaxID=320322 RepID=A0A9E7HBN2_9LILI|nr:40S ribosomal protein [Musa troglodytarum]